MCFYTRAYLVSQFIQHSRGEGQLLRLLIFNLDQTIREVHFGQSNPAYGQLHALKYRGFDLPTCLMVPLITDEKKNRRRNRDVRGDEVPPVERIFEGSKALNE